MPFEFERLAIPDVILIRPAFFGDARGFFAETYKLSQFKEVGIGHHFVQDNHSRSGKGVLRGLHYQLLPKAQGKLLRVVRGAIFDVAVDIRKGSAYYGKWVSTTLSEQNRQMLWIPPGFAHGFITMQDDTDVLYKATDEYDPSLERGIIWNDPKIGIEWPMKKPTLSAKDRQYPMLDEAENNFVYDEVQR
jgi:dTDP-4-dehydrorhamnose 3,5-epimerase